MNLFFNDISLLYQFIKSDFLCIAQKLDFKLYTSDLVLYSQKDNNETSIDYYVSKGMVTILSLNEKQMTELYALHQAYTNNISISDCSICYLALLQRGVLISNDKSVLFVARNHNIKNKQLNVFINELKLLKTG